MKRRKKAAVVVDSPINIFFLLDIIQNYSYVQVIFLIDSRYKKGEDYFALFSMFNLNNKVHSVKVFDYDSKFFWSSKSVFLKFLNFFLINPRLLTSIIFDYDVYSNWFTNPIGLFFKYFKNVQHLYHSPTDIFSIRVLSEKSRLWIIRIKLSGFFSRNDIQIHILHKNFKTGFLPNLNNLYSYRYHNARKIVSKETLEIFSKLAQELNTTDKNALLLILGDISDFGYFKGLNNKYESYLDSIVQTAKNLKQNYNIDCFWIREHYRGSGILSTEDRSMIKHRFYSEGLLVKFISDFLQDQDQIIPGEVFIFMNSFILIAGEASSLMVNVSDIIPKIVISESYFSHIRGKDYMQRNIDFKHFLESVYADYEII